jgi:ubiquinone/menaquinone biosynthesis C-methylase UbiE
MQPVNYNAISKIYDDVREGDIVFIDHFLQGLSPEDNLKILDIGCGTGNYTDLFQRVTQAKHYQIYGIEPSEGMISKAREKNSHILFKQATAENIPFEGKFFDFAFMTDVIHHIPDICKMFAEIYRILKPGGKVCIATQSHPQIAKRPIAQFFPGTVRVDQERYPDIDQIIAAAQSGRLTYLKQEILFEGDTVELDATYLELVRKKGYSMLHLLTEQEYQIGLSKLEHALQSRPVQARMAGETLIWFVKE